MMSPLSPGGHEAVGFVLASKSEKFQRGDPVMALPSSYFKAHTGSKQEWYDEATHSVLLENFPVRGAFSGKPRPILVMAEERC